MKAYPEMMVNRRASLRQSGAMDPRQRSVLVAPVAGRSCRNGACGTGLQLEKSYPGAGSTEADGADGLRSVLFFRFQKSKCPDKSGHLLLAGADCVFTQSVISRFFDLLENLCTFFRIL